MLRLLLRVILRKNDLQYVKLRLKLERLKTAFMVVFCDFILIDMNKTNNKLKSVDIVMSAAVHMKLH